MGAIAAVPFGITERNLLPRTIRGKTTAVIVVAGD